MFLRMSRATLNKKQINLCHLNSLYFSKFSTRNLVEHAKFKSRPLTNSNFMGENFQSTRVFVQNIPVDSSWMDLKRHFLQVGRVVYASISQDALTGK